VVRSGRVEVREMVLLEFSITKGHGAIKVFVVDMRSDLLGRLDGLHQRRTHDLVLADGDNGRRRVSLHVQDGANGFHTLQGREPSVVGACCSSSLGVSEDCRSRVKTKTLGENVLDRVAGDLIQMTVLGTFGDDDNRATLSTLFPVLFENHQSANSYTVGGEEVAGRQTLTMFAHMSSSQPSRGGISGMNSQSAPVLMADISANQPQCLPMTSMTKPL